MNLALIDPFQLAQDSPDALVDEFSKYDGARPTPRQQIYLNSKTIAAATDQAQDLAMQLLSGSVAKATI